MASAKISGLVTDIFEPAEEIAGRRYTKFILRNKRFSGACDVIPCYIAKSNLGDIAVGKYIEVSGRIKTINKDIDGKKKLLIFCLVDEVSEFKDYLNQVRCEGNLCKAPVHRTTPNGLEICDLIIAINDDDGSSYLPSIAWGKYSFIASQLKVGDAIVANGRLQSREYLKAGESTPRVALEFSIKDFEIKDGEWDG